MVDEQKLRDLARAATPGPWIACQYGDYGDYNGDCRVILGEGGDIRTAVVLGFDTPENDANAQLIAAANPAAILAMLDELQTLRSERTAWRSTAENAEAALTLTDETTTQLREQIAALEAAVKQARIDALEDAQKVADELSGFLIGHCDQEGAEIALSVRDSIRSLKETP